MNPCPDGPTLWQDNDLLLPQGFQNENRYHERRLLDLETRVFRHTAGVRKIEFDERALQEGRCALAICQARLDDQTEVIYPGNSIVEPIDLPRTPVGGRHDIYLVVPRHRPGEPNLNLAADDDRRYRKQLVVVADENLGATGDDPLVAFRVLNARLVLEPPPQDRYAQLRLASVEFDSGVPRIVPDSPPALTDLAAWPPLVQRLQRIVDRVAAAAAMLRELADAAVGTMAHAELAIRRNTLAERRLRLRQLLREPPIHPQPVFEELDMLREYLVGCGVSAWEQPPEAVRYRHEAPGEWTGQFERAIGEGLAGLRYLDFTFRASNGLDTVRWDPQLMSLAEQLILVLPRPSRAFAEGEFGRGLRCCLTSQLDETRRQRSGGFALRPVPCPGCLAASLDNIACLRLEPVDTPLVYHPERLVLESRRPGTPLPPRCRLLVVLPERL